MDFLKDAQRKGWIIAAVDEDSALGRCPRQGCSVAIKVRPGGHIPSPCPSYPNWLDHAVTTFEDARVFLRKRREELLLSIKDIEECAGMTVDYLAKFERDLEEGVQRKIPNAMTFFEWCQTLGYDVVLKPRELPPVTVRRIMDTRARSAARTKRYAQERDRRETRR